MSALEILTRVYRIARAMIIGTVIAGWQLIVLVAIALTLWGKIS